VKPSIEAHSAVSTSASNEIKLDIYDMEPTAAASPRSRGASIEVRVFPRGWWR
jgi:hypothetical protein